MFWDRLAAVVTARRSWLIAIAVASLGGALIGLAGADEAGTQSPEFLPTSAEAARAAGALKQFPGGDQAAAILVVTRTDSAVLSPDDLSAVGSAAAPSPVMTSDDGRAAIATLHLDANLSGFALNDVVESLRNSAADRLPDTLIAHVTGGPAFGADIANSFSGANVTLLIVTALVVAVLLIVTYRSPVLWLVPLAVVGFADQAATAVGTAVAGATGLTFDGSTSGITSVLVFGAGTNYALLVISRYREELRHNDDHRQALRRAVRGGAGDRGQQRHRRAGATDVASGDRPQHPKPRRAGGVRTGGRRRVRAAGAAAGAGAVRHPAVLAVRPAARHPGHRRHGPVAPCRQSRRAATGSDRRRRGPGVGGAGKWPAGHQDRAVADRAVPREGRFGERIRHARNAFPGAA